MIPKRDWLWDRKISIEKARVVLRNPKENNFVLLAALLLARKNTPKEVFKFYLKPQDFVRYWNDIKRQMRKDKWNQPRIEFWQAIYEAVRNKYEKRGVVFKKPAAKNNPPDEFCLQIADKIKAARKSRGLTQKELAQRLAISQQVISRIESGGENISLLTLKKITNKLGVGLTVEIL